ncbi:hypothetical protein [Flavobacterium caeni]|uniref:Outer membrane protein beta-barrel domain-containing protein n=1 Tax=Flavobacterium caeni TaxID=490189 RepID=A0A1G5AJG9_9FLAO|nr:hypothetical protein [Flavobacterium caeni]SCX78058.1 hypothetical protein SAMN02927903_00026 [Flavobacterium caeni]
MKLILTGLTLLFGVLSYAQVQFEKGYFVYNAGKKVDCYIENLDWKDNPTSFRYKINPNDKPETENINGVREFAIDGGRVYKRYMMEMERSLPQTNAVQNSRNPDFKIETQFLLLLVSGQASLYEYVQGNVQKFFFETPDKTLEQLVMIRYMESNSGIGENKLFQQQLFNNVRCEKTDDTSFKNMPYSRSVLMAHFERYNSCFDNDAPNKANADKPKETFALRITVGAQMATMKLTDPYSYYDASATINYTSYRLGLEAEAFLPFNHNNWSIFTNPTYQNFDAQKNYVAYVNNPEFFNDGDQLHYTAVVRYATIDIPLGARRHFRFNAHTRMFIDAAYVFPIMVSSDDIVLQNKDGLANASVTLPVEQKGNFAVGVGLGYKKWTAQFRYGAPRVLTDAASWNTKFSSFALQIGYNLL